MKPTLRLSIAITALSTAGFVLAAGEAPTDGIDLGAMKLKSRAAAPVGNVVAAPAPAPALVPKPTGAPVAKTPSVVGAPAPVQTTSQPAAAPTNTASTNQSGIGDVIKSPLGKKAVDILGSPASNKPAQAAEDSSNDVKVKMPSMFRK